MPRGWRTRAREVRLREARALAPPEAIVHGAAWQCHAEATTDVTDVAADGVLGADAVVFGTPTRYGDVAAQLEQSSTRSARSRRKVRGLPGLVAFSDGRWYQYLTGAATSCLPHQGPALVTGWLTTITAVLCDATATPPRPTLIIATIRDLLLDRLATDHDRTEQALTRFIGRL